MLTGFILSYFFKLLAISNHRPQLLSRCVDQIFIGKQAEDPPPSGGRMNAVTPPSNRYLYPVRSAYYQRSKRNVVDEDLLQVQNVSKQRTD